MATEVRVVGLLMAVDLLTDFERESDDEEAPPPMILQVKA
jgi:hypothetical protein